MSTLGLLRRSSWRATDRPGFSRSGIPVTTVHPASRMYPLRSAPEGLLFTAARLQFFPSSGSPHGHARCARQSPGSDIFLRAASPHHAVRRAIRGSAADPSRAYPFKPPDRANAVTFGHGFTLMVFTPPDRFSYGALKHDFPMLSQRFLGAFPPLPHRSSPARRSPAAPTAAVPGFLLGKHRTTLPHNRSSERMIGRVIWKAFTPVKRPSPARNAFKTHVIDR